MSKQNKNHKKLYKKVIVLSVLIVIILGTGLIINRSLLSPSDNQMAAIQANVNNGMQDLTTTLTSGSYPNITVQKDIPVKWNIKADSGILTSCNETLIIPEYGIKISLKAGDNIITFTPTKVGKIKYSCQMGMINGQITVVDNLKGN